MMGLRCSMALLGYSAFCQDQSRATVTDGSEALRKHHIRHFSGSRILNDRSAIRWKCQVEGPNSAVSRTLLALECEWFPFLERPFIVASLPIRGSMIPVWDQGTKKTIKCHLIYINDYLYCIRQALGDAGIKEPFELWLTCPSPSRTGSKISPLRFLP